MSAGHQCQSVTSASESLPPVPVSHGSSASQSGVPVPVSHPKQEGKQKTKQEGKQRENARESRRTPSKSKKVKKPETELPEDWKPTEQHEAFAQEHRIDLQLEVVKFKGYYDGRIAASWNGRFTTWLGNAVGFARERGPRKSQPIQQGLAENVRLSTGEKWGPGGGNGPQRNNPLNPFVAREHDESDEDFESRKEATIASAQERYA